MLVIISDLHLKDGTAGGFITPDIFHIFSERLNSMAYQASWRADGRYQPIDSIDIILMGDILDLVRSERWLVKKSGEPEIVRPWDNPNDADFIQKIQEITDATLTHNQVGFRILKEINQGQTIHLPPATQAGRPDHDAAQKITIPVRSHYLVGNHDWFFCLPGPAFDKIRQRVIDALGLSNSADPFPHDPQDSAEIMGLYRRYRVFARHGDIFDEMNYNAEAGRAVSTVGDAMAVELLTRFPLEVQKQLGAELVPAFSEGLKELSNVRPAIVTPLWISNLINNYAATPYQAEAIKNIWDNAANSFIHLDFVRAHDQRFAFDTVDALESALLFAKGLSIDVINQLASWLNQKFGGADKISFAEHALKEKAYLDRTAQAIVYGHTHFHEIVPLDSSMQDGKMLNQVYINAGTWHSYHDKTLQHPAKLKFVGIHVMTYLAFFKDDERDGRHFETWSGSLSTSS